VVDSPGGTATRFRLLVSYDGTEFHGWARQKELRSVEGELSRVLGQLTGEQIDLTCAGRTDAGVHARGQVAHFDSNAAQHLGISRINRALPGDVRVTGLDVVSGDFDARFSALWRRYSYTVSEDSRGPDPLMRRYQLALSSELDIDAMNDAASTLIGEHDFTSFCKLKEHGSTIREILELRWQRQVDPVSGLGTAVMQVKADAFCHSMVRSLVGALIPVGQGKRPVHYPRQALDQRAREAGVTVMPAHPLVLEEVGYPPPSQWNARQTQTRTLRSAD